MPLIFHWTLLMQLFCKALVWWVNLLHYIRQWWQPPWWWWRPPWWWWRPPWWWWRPPWWWWRPPWWWWRPPWLWWRPPWLWWKNRWEKSVTYLLAHLRIHCYWCWYCLILFTLYCYWNWRWKRIGRWEDLCNPVLLVTFWNQYLNISKGVCLDFVIFKILIFMSINRKRVI